MNSTHLCALLMNPPKTSGDVTRRHLGVAAQILSCELVTIGNLFAIPTTTVLEINNVGRTDDGWQSAQGPLKTAVADATHILAAWGVRGLHGAAAANLARQREWLCNLLLDAGHPNVWTLGGETRHPSRWHQYVSDRHGRTPGGRFEDRIRNALLTCPVELLR
jgi:hypothetical protein